MIEKKIYNTEDLFNKIEELEAKLLEANSIIDAIKDGSVDALVLHQDGIPKIYSIQSADYTYRILIEKFGEGALTISDNGLILFCNDAFSKLIGKPTNAIVGTFFNSYIDTVGKFESIKKALASGQGKGEIVLSVEGKKLPIYISLSDLQPQIPAIGIIVTDLSEKKKHEEAIHLYQQQLEIKVNELNTTNSNLEQFAHVISHDIKEPIRKILTYSEHFESNYNGNGNGQSKNFLKSITTSAHRLNSLVDDLVKYSKGSKSTDFTKVDLNQVMKEVIEDHELLINETDASVRFAHLPEINASAVQIRQLFSNLITNSIKYRKPNAYPVISISTEIVDCIDMHYPNRKFYKLSVKDNGIGMDYKKLGSIFSIFQPKENNDDLQLNGKPLGVGLALCKRIMENHEGKIDAESAQNDGTTINLYFPVQQVL